MQTLIEKLENLLGAAIHNHADHRDVAKEVLDLIRNHTPAPADRDRVAMAIQNADYKEYGNKDYLGMADAAIAAMRGEGGL